MITESSFYCDPTQVIFADPYNDFDWTGGIAYKDEVICGVCGDAISLVEIYEKAAEAGIDEPVLEDSLWKSLDTEITGGSFPMTVWS